MSRGFNTFRTVRKLSTQFNYMPTDPAIEMSVTSGSHVKYLHTGVLALAPKGRQHNAASELVSTTAVIEKLALVHVC